MGKFQFLLHPKYFETIRCPILMIKRLHDANSHVAFYYDYAQFLQIVLLYEIKKIYRCLIRLISETAIRFGSLSRWGDNDDGV